MKNALFIGGSHDGAMKESPVWSELTIPKKRDPLTIYSILEEVEPIGTHEEVERYYSWLPFDIDGLLFYVHSSLTKQEAIEQLVAAYQKGKQ